MENLQTQFEHFIQQHQLIRPGNRVVLAVSGGIDSMTMLDLFLAIRTEWKLALCIAHVNHTLRGEESDGDEAFVRHVAETTELPFYSARVPTHQRAHEHHCSTQEAARELRYEFLQHVRSEFQAQLIATAHHANDNAETVVMNAVRGTGLRGLAGIPLRREELGIVRPMLFASRREIETYADARDLHFREDSSNKSFYYTRNLLRRRILPAMQQELGTDINELLNRFSNVIRALNVELRKVVDERMIDLVRTEVDGTLKLDVPAWQNEPEFLQSQMLLELLRRAGIEPTGEKVKHLMHLCHSESGHWINLPKSQVALRDHQFLRIGGRVEERPIQVAVSCGKRYEFDTFSMTIGMPEPKPARLADSKDIEFADADKLCAPLAIRSWHEGDWFVPLGLGARKKLSDFFVNEKLSIREKQQTPLLTSGNDIVWVVGRRLDDRFKITPATREAVKFIYHQNV